MIRRPKVESHQHEERREKARCLTEREMAEKTQRQGGLDREVRVRPLRASRARSVRVPGGEGRRGQPDGDVASTDQSAIRGGPVLDVVLCLVRGMDARFHPSSLVCPLATSLRIRAPTPASGALASRAGDDAGCVRVPNRAEPTCRSTKGSSIAAWRLRSAAHLRRCVPKVSRAGRVECHPSRHRVSTAAATSSVKVLDLSK